MAFLLIIVISLVAICCSLASNCWRSTNAYLATVCSSRPSELSIFNSDSGKNIKAFQPISGSERKSILSRIVGCPVLFASSVIPSIRAVVYRPCRIVPSNSTSRTSYVRLRSAPHQHSGIWDAGTAASKGCLSRWKVITTQLQEARDSIF